MKNQIKIHQIINSMNLNNWTKLEKNQVVNKN